MASVRGIGVAVITRIWGGCAFLVQSRARCSTPKRCCSSITTNPRSANRTRSSISACVPISMFTLPEAIPSERLAAFAGLRGAGEDRRRHLRSREHPADRCEVLAGENLRGSHHAGLESVVHGQQHRHQRHEGLAAAHVALQEAVHLESRHGVLPDFADHALLRSREREGQFFVVEGVERLPDLRKEGSRRSWPAAPCAGLDVELHAEQLVELQPVLRLTQQLPATGGSGCCSRPRAAESVRSGCAALPGSGSAMRSRTSVKGCRRSGTCLSRPARSRVSRSKGRCPASRSRPCARGPVRRSPVRGGPSTAPPR